MKRNWIVALVVTIALGGALFAGQGLPTSNVLFDTSATANTLVMRDSDGGTEHLAGDIVTADIGSQAVTTVKMYLDLPSSTVPCVTTAKRIGYCTSLNASTGVCNNCN